MLEEGKGCAAECIITFNLIFEFMEINGVENLYFNCGDFYARESLDTCSISCLCGFGDFHLTMMISLGIINHVSLV